MDASSPSSSTARAARSSRQLSGTLVASLAALLLATACSAGGDSEPGFTIDEERVATFSWDGTLADAIQAFGEPASRQAAAATFCTLTWPEQAITMETAINPFVSADPCVDDARHSSTTVADERWHTSEGLRVGDSVERLHELYPDAQPGTGSGDWVLATRPLAGLPFPGLEASVIGERVVSFTVHGPREPQ